MPEPLTIPRWSVPTDVALDPVRSPHTGLTRAHWGAVADHLLTSLRPWASPDRARIDLPGPSSSYGRDSDSLEAFARSFLLVAIRLKGDDGVDPHGFAEWYAAGLAAGTDPASPTAWPRPDTLAQAKVEACSIALGLHWTRPWIWDRLSDRTQAQVVDWLGGIVGDPGYPANNWVWFKIVVETFLKSVGGPWSAQELDDCLAFHESLYRGHGWYADGPERSFDHYNGWALQVYPLVWADMDPELAAAWPVDQWRDRLRELCGTAVALVGADGAPLAQGRSLVYRFAAAAPLWMGAVSGATDLPLGQVRRATSGILRHFLDRGVPDDRGLLTLGWTREWPQMKQSYSGPGSPYWAVKGMLGLALPADHPVWTAVEEPLPIETGDVALALREPGWLVSGTRADGIVRVVNHGTDHAAPGDLRSDSPLYARLGYSTATIPPMALADYGRADENSVVLRHLEHGASHRTGWTTGECRRDGDVLVATSAVAVHWVATQEDTGPEHGSGRGGSVVHGPRMTLASVLRGAHEVRVAVVDAAAVVDGGCRLEMSGWPVPDPDPRPGDPGRVTGAAGLVSRVVPLSPELDLLSVRRLGASPLGDDVAAPAVTTSAPPVPGTPYAAVVTLGAANPGGLPEVSSTVSATGVPVVTVTWDDGTSTPVELAVG